MVGHKEEKLLVGTVVQQSPDRLQSVLEAIEHGGTIDLDIGIGRRTVTRQGRHGGGRRGRKPILDLFQIPIVESFRLARPGQHVGTGRTAERLGRTLRLGILLAVFLFTAAVCTVPLLPPCAMPVIAPTW